MPIGTVTGFGTSEGGAGGALTVRLTCLELLPPALVARTMKVETLSAVGVPLMMPVEEPKLSPEGSAPVVTLHVSGVVPVAARVCEYALPVTAPGKGDVVKIEGGVTAAGAAISVTDAVAELAASYVLVAVIVTEGAAGALTGAV